MKRLKTTNITTTAGLPIQGPTLDFLQDASKEALNSLARAIITNDFYDANTPYVLFGCTNSGSGSNYIIAAGAIYYQGEVWLVPAATFTISGPNIARLVVTSNWLAGVDPVQFTDLSTHNVHEDKILQPQAGATGIDYGTIRFFNKRTTITLNSPYSVLGALSLGIRFERKIGGFVIVEGNFTVSSNVTSGGIIGTMPTIGGVSIATDLIVPCSIWDGTNMILVNMVLRANGEFRIAKGSDWTTNTFTITNGSQICFNMTYGKY
jgi:hypothetical protein